MKKVLKDAIAIDEEARKKVEVAKDKQNSIHEIIKEKKNTMYAEMMQNVENATSEFQRDLEEKIKAQEAANQSEVNATIAKMEAKYQSNKDIWVNEIVANIVNH